MPTSAITLSSNTKCDVAGAEENVAAFKKKYGRKYKIFPITAVSGDVFTLITV